MARTNTNPNQPNRRASILNSRPLGGNRDSILSGGFLNNITGGAQQRDQQFGGAVPLTAIGPQQPQQPQPQGPQVPQMQGPEAPAQRAAQAPVQPQQQQVPVQAVTPRTEAPAAPQTRTAAIPTQPGGEVAGGVPVQAVSGQPMSREQQLEQTINQLLTQQEQQIGTLESQGAARGIVRPFAQGVEGAVRRQTAAEVAPFQRELGALRERGQREFERNIAERQLALQEMNIRSQIASRNAMAEAAAQGISLPPMNTTDGERFEVAFKFKQNAKGLQELLNNSGKSPRELAVSQGPDGDTFRSLRADLVDIMARDRTGAVVGEDEKKAFNKILGVGAFRTATRSAESIAEALDRAVESANITSTRIDPSGQWDLFLTTKFGLPGAQQELVDSSLMQGLSDAQREELINEGLL